MSREPQEDADPLGRLLGAVFASSVRIGPALLAMAGHLVQAQRALEDMALASIGAPVRSGAAAAPSAPAAAPDPAAGPGPGPASDASPAAVFAHLLDQAQNETFEEARTARLMRIVTQLTPDEARILAALADGSAYPVVHVDAGGQRIAANHSSIGREATVHARELTPQYLSHLIDLGLAVLDGERPQFAPEYELLEADTPVREALERPGRRLARPRPVRDSVVLSPFGANFWKAVTP